MAFVIHYQLSIFKGNAAMSSKEIEKRHHQTFEEIKQTGENGKEFWTARKL